MHIYKQEKDPFPKEKIKKNVIDRVFKKIINEKFIVKTNYDKIVYKNLF